MRLSVDLPIKVNHNVKGQVTIITSYEGGSIDAFDLYSTVEEAVQGAVEKWIEYKQRYERALLDAKQRHPSSKSKRFELHLSTPPPSPIIDAISDVYE